MLELLISILLSFGLSPHIVEGRVAVNPEVVYAAKSSPAYAEKGGDAAFNSILIPDDVDPTR